MAVIDFLEDLGRKISEGARRPLKKVPKAQIQERLRRLKELQMETPEGRLEEEREKLVEEVLQWRKEEISKPLSERLAEALLRHFRGPISSLTQSFKGLDYDLFRASMFISKEKYVAQMLVVSFFAGIFAFIFAYLMYMPLETSILIGLLGFLGGFGYMRQYPRMVWKRRVTEVERALPYALRHMASLLSAGVGIEEAILSVARADYGVLSEEFDLMLRDMRTGASLEEALQRFEEKMASDKVSRVVKQILRAVKFGGNLSDILYKMAEDFAFEYRMRLVEYVQKVNGVSFVYMFMTIVMPTMFIVGILAGSIMAQALIFDIQTMAIILLVAFPGLSLIIINLIKKAEPR
ncbi:type II secretion system F family protein [Thermococcus sp.]|uniref:type II secretion system F family protein n=1 Tax=Thermococcus sp. TaxID=35749 RepID=UPI00262948DF|nr:type II secretion system F family protein [Thermococcus sp.]